MANVDNTKQLVRIRLCGNKPLIFNVDDVKRLRCDLRIVGSLVGSLPRFPQQNSFYGLPVLLLPEEATFVLQNGWGTLSDNDTTGEKDKTWVNEKSIKYQVYRYLWQQGLYITSGEKFGGDYLAYPGDPMRFHSHYIISVQQDGQTWSLMDLVAMGRLATNTKKTFVLAGSTTQDVENTDQDRNNNSKTTLEDEAQITCFSITWAGF
ncbi:tRNA intron endonuclease [Halteromyces radiatus]|uniref:tRNA intron endonuclease n=1 Tax=Halteromyces radiatus TaxID=101107 RepID=UPI00221F67C8|nr:tRNA intron endonuclease [Halteromyces radiatus]KAI8079787.1 tRNA intron endonuclease [Halteromyces radiatus]